MKKFFLFGCLALLLLLGIEAKADEITFREQHGTMWSAWSESYGAGLMPNDGNMYFWSPTSITIYRTHALTNATKTFEADAAGASVYGIFYAKDAITTPGSLTGTGGTIDQSNLTKVTGFARQATVINSPTQLSSWSGQAAVNGVSWFPLESGKSYEIDLVALSHPTIASANTGYVCSGVTLVLWDATEANDQRPTEITIIPPSGSYAASEISGTTTVWIVPYPGTNGLTAYGIGAEKYAVAYRSACTPQTLQGDYQLAGVSGVMTGSVLSGASIAVLNRIGESVTMQTRYNSAVSAWMKNAMLKWPI